MRAAAKILEGVIGAEAANWLRRLQQHGRHLPFLLRRLWRGGRPGVVVRYGDGAGDNLLCTIPIHELRRRQPQNIWVLTRHPGIFQHSPEAGYVTDPDPRFEALRDLTGCRWPRLDYAPYDQSQDRSRIPTEHIAKILCRQAGITGRIEIKPHIFLRPREIAQARHAQGRIIIQSSGMGGPLPMANKQWRSERFQEVVNTWAGKRQFIQIGAAQDPPLAGALDLRGRTAIRESAALLREARLFVGTVGMLMHLARAVDCPAVIVYGGREAPWQSGYTGNLNLYSEEPCAPCWLWNRCDYHHHCMERIQAADVCAAIETMLARSREELPLDQADI